MFRAFLTSKFNSKNELTYLLIGEDHGHSSGLIAVADSIEVLKTKEREVIIFTEVLPRLKTLLGKDIPYTQAEIKKSTLQDKDYDKIALIELIKNGATIFGIETEISDPMLNKKFNNTADVMKVYERSVKKYISPETKKHLNVAYRDSSTSPNALIQVIRGAFGITLERLTFSNPEWVKQIMTVTRQALPSKTISSSVSSKSSSKGEEKQSKNRFPLYIFIGGSKHIVQVFNEQNEIVEKGIQERLKEEKNITVNMSVDACFVTSSLKNLVRQNDLLIYQPNKDTHTYNPLPAFITPEVLILNKQAMPIAKPPHSSSSLILSQMAAATTLQAQDFIRSTPDSETTTSSLISSSSTISSSTTTQSVLTSSDKLLHTLTDSTALPAKNLKNSQDNKQESKNVDGKSEGKLANNQGVENSARDTTDSKNMKIPPTPQPRPISRTNSDPTSLKAARKAARDSATSSTSLFPSLISESKPQSSSSSQSSSSALPADSHSTVAPGQVTSRSRSR